METFEHVTPPSEVWTRNATNAVPVAEHCFSFVGMRSYDFRAINSTMTPDFYVVSQATVKLSRRTISLSTAACDDKLFISYSSASKSVAFSVSLYRLSNHQTEEHFAGFLKFDSRWWCIVMLLWLIRELLSKWILAYSWWNKTLKLGLYWLNNSVSDSESSLNAA